MANGQLGDEIGLPFSNHFSIIQPQKGLLVDRKEQPGPSDSICLAIAASPSVTFTWPRGETGDNWQWGNMGLGTAFDDTYVSIAVYVYMYICIYVYVHVYIYMCGQKTIYCIYTCQNIIKHIIVAYMFQSISVERNYISLFNIHLV